MLSVYHVDNLIAVALCCAPSADHWNGGRLLRKTV